MQPSCGRGWILFGSMVDAFLIYNKEEPLQIINLTQNSVVLGDQLQPDSFSLLSCYVVVVLLPQMVLLSEGNKISMRGLL